MWHTMKAEWGEEVDASLWLFSTALRGGVQHVGDPTTIDHRTVRVGGGTNLFDAMDHVITHEEYHLGTGYTDKFFHVITDGEENASTKVTKEAWLSKKTHMQDVKGWKIYYLGGDPEDQACHQGQAHVGASAGRCLPVRMHGTDTAPNLRAAAVATARASSGVDGAIGRGFTQFERSSSIGIVGGGRGHTAPQAGVAFQYGLAAPLPRQGARPWTTLGGTPPPPPPPVASSQRGALQGGAEGSQGGTPAGGDPPAEGSQGEALLRQVSEAVDTAMATE